MQFIPMIILIVILLFAAMYMAFRSLKVKMMDILEDVNSGVKIREDIMKCILSQIKGNDIQEYNRLNSKMGTFNKFYNIKEAKKKVDYDEEMEEIVCDFLTLPKRNQELMDNFSFIELILQLKNLEARIINAKYKYNGFIDKYNTKRETPLGKVFAKIYRFEKMDKIYLSYQIKDILENENI